MKRFPFTLPAVVIGAVCAWSPVMAQSTGASGQTSQPATQATAQPAPDTRAMGAGPAAMDSAPDREDNDHNLGWLGLLGLAGLLGLRRRHDRPVDVSGRQPSATR